MSDSKSLRVFKKIVLSRFFFLFIDALTVLFSYTSILLLLNDIIPKEYLTSGKLAVFVLPATVISIFVFILCRFYSNLWEFAGTSEIPTLCAGVFFSGALIFVYGRFILCLPYSKMIYISAAVYEFILMGFARIGYKYFYNICSSPGIRKRSNLIRTMIVGAGSAGCMLLREIRINNRMNLLPVVFIDDDKSKHNKRIGNITVFGCKESIPAAIQKFNIQQIIIAIPSAPAHVIREIAEICTNNPVKVKIMPDLNKILVDGIPPTQLRNIDIRDFLSRDEVVLDNTGIGKTINGNTILITGGGGSIGSEICRQIAPYAPTEIIIYDIYENNAYELQQELKRGFPEVTTRVLIGSVRDLDRLDCVFSKYKPSVVFHAAAHKHVPLMEESPAEAVKNNIFGTMNVCQVSDKHSVDSFVLISTDKAVNPTNVMGATKRVAEMIVQHMNSRSKTRFVAVRFGNVLGSSGSVVPLFRRQIESGGPVLVTHPEIVRFFMTIPEAAQLVLQACSMAKGGEIFILDMGNPVKIDDLARKMITLSGHTPDVDIKIQYIGLRPGEKLYEELLLSEEGVSSTKHSKIYTARPLDISDALCDMVCGLSKCLDDDDMIVSEIEAIIKQKLKDNHRNSQ